MEQIDEEARGMINDFGVDAYCEARRVPSWPNGGPVRSRSNRGLAFSRTENRATGEFEEAVLLARFGEVDLDSLRG